MAKCALVVGINDYSVQSEHDANLYNLSWPNLSYCVNDADSMYHLLIQAFGFEASNVILLKDARATRRNILSSLAYLLANAEPGDVVCFFYAGHGGLLPASTRAMNTQFYEAIIPYQGDWIYDFRLDEIAEHTGFNPNEVNLTCILDCCHAGGIHTTDSIEQSIPRTVPFRPDVLSTVQHVQTWWPFGMCLPNGSSELIPNVGNPTLQNQGLVDLDVDPDKTLVQSAKSTLIAACKYYETAGETNTYRHGNLTQGFLDIVNSSNFSITHHELIEQLVTRVRTISGNTQTPQLRGQVGRADHNFLEGWRESI